MPLHRSVFSGRLALRAGFLLYRLIAFDRNRGVPPPLRLPGGTIISRDDAAQRFPGLRRKGLTGAGMWHDYVTVESDRLTFSFALAAHEHGAVLANHIDAVSLLKSDGRVTGVQARDLLTGREYEVSARLTVNATSTAADRLLDPIGIPWRLPTLKAMNLVIRRDAGEEALAVRSPSGRHLILVPWRGQVVAGTWESTRPSHDGALDVSSDEIQAFIDELNRTFPALDLRADEVAFVHRGLVPAVLNPDGSARLDRQDRSRDHADQGVEGLLSVAGTKYTTARAVAERTVDRAFAKLGRSLVTCRTATIPLPGGSVRDAALAVAEARRHHDQELPSDTIPHLVAAYGSRYRDIIELAAARPHWRTRVADDSPVVGAELVWAARKEMAVTLADAVIRRTPLGAIGCPSDATLDAAAQFVGTELGWSETERLEQIAAVRAFYEIAARP
jgi:glycerol-3-phosphate dehydrogenase